MSIDFDNPPEDKLLVPKKFVPTVITGGKGPPTTSSNWLSNLEQGDYFLARHKDKAERNFELHKFCVMFKTEKSVKLMVYLDEDSGRMIKWVEPKVFSNEMIFQEVIGNANNEASSTPTTEGE